MQTSAIASIALDMAVAGDGQTVWALTEKGFLQLGVDALPKP